MAPPGYDITLIAGFLLCILVVRDYLFRFGVTSRCVRPEGWAAGDGGKIAYLALRDARYSITARRSFASGRPLNDINVPGTFADTLDR